MCENNHNRPNIAFIGPLHGILGMTRWYLTYFQILVIVALVSINHNLQNSTDIYKDWYDISIYPFCWETTTYGGALIRYITGYWQAVLNSKKSFR